MLLGLGVKVEEKGPIFLGQGQWKNSPDEQNLFFHPHPTMRSSLLAYPNSGNSQRMSQSTLEVACTSTPEKSVHSSASLRTTFPMPGFLLTGQPRAHLGALEGLAEAPDSLACRKSLLPGSLTDNSRMILLHLNSSRQILSPSQSHLRLLLAFCQNIFLFSEFALF